jgi:hypothetical protein
MPGGTLELHEYSKGTKRTKKPRLKDAGKAGLFFNYETTERILQQKRTRQWFGGRGG